MKKVSFIGFDFLLFFAVLGLIIIGILFIYSSGVTSTGVVVSNEYIKQIIWAISGIVLFVLFSYISYERYKNWAVYIYFISILLLIVTPIIGKEVNGAKSWLGIADIGIQPSEFSKISVILFLAYYFYSVKKEIKKLSKFLIGFIIVLVRMALILLQPDTGTAIVYFPIFLFMAFIAGADLKHIMFLIFVALVAGILISFSAIKEYIITENSPLLNILSDPSVYKYFLISISIILLIAALGYFLFRRRYFY